MIPREPAVIPTATKNTNSNRPCAESGVEIKILLKNDSADNSIEVNVCSD